MGAIAIVLLVFLSVMLLGLIALNRFHDQYHDDDRDRF